MMMMSKPLNSTGPNASTKPNRTMDEKTGPILDLTSPSMEQLTKPQPSTRNTDYYY